MRKIVPFFMVFIFLFVMVFSVKSNAKLTGAQMACSFALAGYMQKINIVHINTTQDYYLLRNVNNTMTQTFGKLPILLEDALGDRMRLSFNANWNTIAFSIYKILKQDRKNALYLLFLTSPIKKDILSETAKKRGWTLESSDTMFINYITSQKIWSTMKTLGITASAFTALIAKNLKFSDATNINILTQTIYALTNKKPVKEIKQIYKKYMHHIYAGYKTDPISYCGLFLGK